MKEIEKKDTPEVSGGYHDDGTGGGCIPIAPIGPMPVELPGGPVYPRAPNSPWAGPELYVTDPPAV
jgi:hypothetical protein